MWTAIPWKLVAKVAGILIPAIVVFGLGCRAGAARQAKADARELDKLSDQVVELELEAATLRSRLETREEVLANIRTSILEAREDRQRFLDSLSAWRSQPSRIVERIERVPVEVTATDCQEAIGEGLAIVRNIAELEAEVPE